MISPDPLLHLEGKSRVHKGGRETMVPAVPGLAGAEALVAVDLWQSRGLECRTRGFHPCSSTVTSP